MFYGSATVLGRVERRRRFSIEQKLAVVAQASVPGASISEVARRHELLPAQVFKWRRLAELGVIGIPGASELPSFVSVGDHEEYCFTAGAFIARPTGRAGEPGPRRRRRGKIGLIEIELGSGQRMRVDRDVDGAALCRVLDVLSQR